MRVKVQTILDLVPIIGSQLEIDVPEGATVRTALETLVNRFGETLKKKLINPADTQPYPYFRLVLNGRDLHAEKRLETPLREGDTLLIIPPASGG